MSGFATTPIAQMAFLTALTVLDGVFGLGFFFSGLLLLGAVIYAYSNEYLTIWQLALSGIVGAMIADNIGFHLGRRAKNLGRALPFNQAIVSRFYSFAEKLGSWDILIVIFGRSFAYSRPIAPFMVGFSGTGARRYLFMSLVSAVLWVGAWLIIALTSLETLQKALEPSGGG